MPTTINGVTTYAGGESMPAAGSEAYSRLPSQTPIPVTPTPTMPVITPTQAVPTPAPFNETNARNNAIAQREQDFNAIDTDYKSRIAQMTADEQKLGERDMARANTISAMTGMAGGVDATSRAGAVDKKTNDIIQQKTAALNAQKANAIAGIYDKIDSNVQREKEIGLQNERADRTKLVDDMNRSAEANIMEFASHGISWENAEKNSPEFMDEVKRTGKDPFELKKAYEVTRAANNIQQTNFTTKVQGNKVISSWVDTDPITGKHTPKFETTDIPGLSPEMTHSHFDPTSGKLIVWDDQGNSKVTNIAGTGGGSSGKPPTGTPQGMTASDIEEGRTRLTSIGANGGYANPYLYRDMFDLWVNNGGDRGAFLKAYPPKQYINPAHNNLKNSDGEYVLPEYLRPTTAKPSSSTEYSM